MCLIGKCKAALLDVSGSTKIYRCGLTYEQCLLDYPDQKECAERYQKGPDVGAVKVPGYYDKENNATVIDFGEEE